MKDKTPKEYIKRSDLPPVIESIIKQFYLPTMVNQAIDKAEYAVTKQIMSGTFDQYLTEMVRSEVMRVVGELLVSRIKIDVSMLKVDS